jgi:hypothetical protein
MRPLVLLLALASCTHWTPIAATSLRDERALVVSGDRAYDLHGAHIQGDAVVGVQQQVWQPQPCFKTPDDPDDDAIAKCWRAIPLEAATPIELQQGAIQRVTANRSWTGGTVLLVSTIVIGVVLIGGAVIGATAGGGT